MSKEKRLKFRAGARTLMLKPVPKALITEAMSEEGKPLPPKKAVEYMGGVIRMEDDFENEEYQRSYGMWGIEHVSRLTRICLAFGVDEVVGPPPSEEEMNKLRSAFGVMTPEDEYIKWLLMLVGDQQQGFLNLCMGQTEPTPEALEEAENRFRPADSGAGVHGEGNGLQAPS